MQIAAAKRCPQLDESVPLAAEDPVSRCSQDCPEMAWVVRLAIEQRYIRTGRDRTVERRLACLPRLFGIVVANRGFRDVQSYKPCPGHQVQHADVPHAVAAVSLREVGRPGVQVHLVNRAWARPVALEHRSPALPGALGGNDCLRVQVLGHRQV